MWRTSRSAPRSTRATPVNRDGECGRVQGGLGAVSEASLHSGEGRGPRGQRRGRPPDDTGDTEQEHGGARHHVHGEERVVTEGLVRALTGPATAPSSARARARARTTSAAPPLATVVHVEQVSHGELHGDGHEHHPVERLRDEPIAVRTVEQRGHIPPKFPMAVFPPPRHDTAAAAPARSRRLERHIPLGRDHYRAHRTETVLRPRQRPRGRRAAASCRLQRWSEQ